MKQLAIALATGALVLATPVLASDEGITADTDLHNNPPLTFSHEGVEYEYSRDDITIRGDIAGGKNTLEGHAARAEAKRLAAIGYRDMQERFDVDEIAPNKFRWNDKGATGEAKVVISLDRQMAFAYKGNTLVGAASISSAREGMITPTGIFPIWLKKPMHYSQKYDDAPMPYMQMIDEYGIALHAGHNPGRPDSHGCIRLPKEFAKKLFALTETGSHVYIGA